MHAKRAEVVCPYCALISTNSLAHLKIEQTDSSILSLGHSE